MNKIKLFVALVVAATFLSSCDSTTTVTTTSRLEGSYTVSEFVIEGQFYTDFFNRAYDFYSISFDPVTESRGDVSIDAFGQDPEFGTEVEVTLDANYRLTDYGTLVLTELNGNEIGEYNIDFDGSSRFLLSSRAGTNEFDLDQLIFPPGLFDVPYFISSGDLVEVEFRRR